MKRISAGALFLALATIITLSTPSPVMAEDQYIFGIMANRTAIEMQGEAGFYLQPSTFYAGANGVYHEDRYRMLGAHAMVGNVIYPGLTGKIGFKGYFGRFERSNRNNQDLGALAFVVSASYDLSDVIAAHYIPVILHATFSAGPRPTSFSDTERFFEGVLAADWMFLENAAITASFRYVDAKFDEWSRSHGTGYLGFKFVF